MLNPDQYYEVNLEAAHRYAEDIRDKITVSNKWIKLAVDRYFKDLEREDLVKNYDKLRLSYLFFSLLRINIKGQYQQYKLTPYQSFILLNLNLFYYTHGRRRFRTLFLFVARKNAKTTFAVALNLYFLIMDNVTDPQSLLIAAAREQANIALDYAKSIIQNSPALHSRSRIMQYQIRFNSGESRGFMKTVASADPRKLDGYNISSAVLDEIHAYTSDDLYNVVKSGIVSRKDPIIFLISTAGFIVDSFCNDMVSYAKNVLLGDVQDDTFFTLLYMLDEDDDFHDPDTWIKANPALGEIVSLEDLLVEYNQAVAFPTQLPNFLTKHLNKFVEGVDQWIPEDILLAASTPIPEISSLEGADLYIGMDLSSTRDLTAVIGIIHDLENNKFYTLPRFYFANNPKRRLRQGGVNLNHWIRDGHITQCQTATIDYDLLYDNLIELSQTFNIVGIAYDPYNSDLIIPRLEDYGINCYKFDQTAKQFNFPLKYLEKCIHEGSLILSDNPVLPWNFRNIVLYKDGNNNIKILKNKSADSVDGAVGLAMALGIWIAINLDPEAANLTAYINKSE